MMHRFVPGSVALVLCAFIAVVPGADVSAEVLVRWDQDRIPSPQSLGISSIVVPGSNKPLINDALRQGYRVLLEVDAAAAAAITPPVQGSTGVILSGDVAPQAFRELEKKLAASGFRVLAPDDRGKWPHIRTNWVTKNNEVLQVANRSAQPWIDSNAALIRIARAADPDRPLLLAYPWKPIMLAEIDEGPSLENYLVAIAEAGSFGADLVLPLHARFQQKLLLGDPQARREWAEVRRAIEFYAWDLPVRYTPVTNVGVVTAEPAQSFEVMNLLARHNVPFELVTPASLPKLQPAGFDLLLVLDPLKDAGLAAATDFAKKGGTLVIVQPSGSLPWRRDAPAAKTDRHASYRFEQGRVVEVLAPVVNPDEFALEIRRLLGPDRRALDLWNGITVLAASYRNPDGDSALVTAVNYAHQPLPVQLRIKGTFSVVQYESPEEAITLLPYQHRDGFTEFVVPRLRVGGRIFLGH